MGQEHADAIPEASSSVDFAASAFGYAPGFRRRNYLKLPDPVPVSDAALAAIVERVPGVSLESLNIDPIDHPDVWRAC